MSLPEAHYEISGHIWLYRTPYIHPELIENPVPELLNETTTIHVFLNSGEDYQKNWPPLPLLGLEWLNGNKLALNVDGRSERFTIVAM
jgi:hypothetical protein